MGIPTLDPTRAFALDLWTAYIIHHNLSYNLVVPLTTSFHQPCIWTFEQDSLWHQGPNPFNYTAAMVFGNEIPISDTYMPDINISDSVWNLEVIRS